jgi:ribosomal protein S18 acetylase RimI-like enzyme
MLIRLFDGSRRDAKGLLAVERDTFAESPYDADEVIHLFTKAGQRAWLAIVEGEVTGFVAGFPTYTLRGCNWEVDLVAVQPASHGQGIATELIRAAVEDVGECSLNRSQIAPAGFAIQQPGGGFAIRREQNGDLLSLDQARAVVATDNLASQRAFTKAGFTLEEAIYSLLLYEIRGFAPRPLDLCPVTVRDLARSTREAVAVLRLGEGLMRKPGRSRLRSNDFSCPGARATEVATTSRVRHLLRPDDVLALASRKANEILVAVREGETTGFAELLYVETLFYQGIWLESLVAQGADREIQAALISEAVERAKRKRLDEIGCLVNVEDPLLREALVGQGFEVVNECYIFRRDL